MPELRMIDANALKSLVSEVFMQDDVDRIIDGALTIDPVRHAHWIQDPDDAYHCRPFPRCSACGKRDEHMGKFCRECGAKMDEEVPAP